MKKTLYSFLLVALLSAFIYTPQAKAQNLDKDAKSAALEMCGCMNNFFNELHPQLIQLMNDMAELGEEEAQANFVSYLMSASPEEQAEIQEDVMRMQNASDEIEVYCQEVKDRYASYDNNSEFKDKMINALQKEADCSLVAKMMKLGQQTDDEE